MNITDFTVGFGLGLAGSVHCAQMCGPIVLGYSLGLTRGSLFPHLAYNAGRIVTYTALGAVAGSLGSLFSLGAAHRAALFGAGMLMVLAGTLLAGWRPRSGLTQVSDTVSSKLARLSSRFLLAAGSANKFLLGLLLGFLPCGLLWAGLLKAAGSGTASGGALSMLGFGIGTATALLAIGLFSSTLVGRLGRVVRWLPAASVIATGLFLMYKGWVAGGITPPAPEHQHHHGHS